MNSRPYVGRSMRLVAAALLVTGVVNTIVYAVMIARGYQLAPGHPEAFRDLQRAMTWADGYMTIAVLAGGTGLWLGRWWGRLLGVVGAAALFYMGILDVAFLAQHGMYAHFDHVVLIMIVVDAWALGVGAWIVFTLMETSTERQRSS
ncbi:MAG: hypothetical protein HY899_00065 [Deltaproteobacteria bacterium]|nr:hypothetical protein [Deltaproteobacteria bacterium]